MIALENTQSARTLKAMIRFEANVYSAEIYNPYDMSIEHTEEFQRLSRLTSCVEADFESRGYTIEWTHVQDDHADESLCDELEGQLADIDEAITDLEHTLSLLRSRRDGLDRIVSRMYGK
jgi:hypothetical protein